ncbi:MAG: PTS glucose/sucrose transporter subunit IIB [Clostridia bacterium]
MAKLDYAQMAKVILKGVGGKDNIEEADFCSTRIRFDLHDTSVVDEKSIKACGCPGIMRFGKGSVQVIVGTYVQAVFDELEELIND